MSTKRRLKKANSLHVQMIFALVLACVLPLAVVATVFIRGYREQRNQELQNQVQELCADFANRIQNTGYLTNSAQAELSSAMDTAAQIFDGRILVVNSELQIVKDTFNREEGRNMISEEVVRALKEREQTYLFSYEDTTEIICQIRDSLGENVLGCVVYIYQNPNYVNLSDEISRNSFLLTYLKALQTC